MASLLNKTELKNLIATATFENSFPNEVWIMNEDNCDFLFTYKVDSDELINTGEVSLTWEHSQNLKARAYKFYADNAPDSNNSDTICPADYYTDYGLNEGMFI